MNLINMCYVGQYTNYMMEEYPTASKLKVIEQKIEFHASQTSILRLLREKGFQI
jgi:hypothetical protein